MDSPCYLLYNVNKFYILKVLLMFILIVVMVFGMCFALFNYWFQRDKYKRLVREEIKKLNRFNSPGAWLTYTIVFFIGLLVIVSYYIYKLYVAIFQLS